MGSLKINMSKYIEGLPQDDGYFDTEQRINIFREDINDDLWLKKLNVFFDYLTRGEVPEGVYCVSPKLSQKKASEILWFLHEVIGIIPDEYAVCANCGTVNNTGNMDYYETNGKYYCSGCIDSSPFTHCDNCYEDVSRRRAYSDKDGMFLCKECRKKIRKEENENE